MINNDIFRRLRFILNINDSKMIELFELANHKVERYEVSNWLKKEDDSSYREMTDNKLAIFLNGLIIHKRGKRDGEPPIHENRLSNNIILKKLKIAFDLKTDDILEMLKSIDKPIGEHELSSFFRNPNHSKFRLCNDQYLRNFLNAMLAKYRTNEVG